MRDFKRTLNMHEFHPILYNMSNLCDSLLWQVTLNDNISKANLSSSKICLFITRSLVGANTGFVIYEHKITVKTRLNVTNTDVTVVCPSR